MSTTKSVAVLVGSLRKDSLNRKIAHVLASLAPVGCKLEIVEIGQMQLYNQDLDAAPPAEWVAFRQKIKAADALLFVTPEYSRSVPGALKNAIDIGSRPYAQSAWDGKPGAVTSVSPSPLGAFGAHHHLRQFLVFLNVPTLQQPEAYIGAAGSLFDAQGKLTKEKTREFLTKFMAAFALWVDLFRKA